MSWPNYQDIRARSTSFADITAHRSAIMALSESDGAVRLMGQAVTANFFTSSAFAPRWAARCSRRTSATTSSC